MPLFTPRSRRRGPYNLLTPLTRGLLTGRRKSGESYNYIINITKTFKTTIRNIIKKYIIYYIYYNKPKTGRFFTLNQYLKSRIVRII